MQRPLTQVVMLSFGASALLPSEPALGSLKRTLGSLVLCTPLSEGNTFAGVPVLFCRAGTVVVEPSIRRSGVGRDLMSVVETWAKSEGCSEVRLNVYSFSEAALSFYGKLGYAALSDTLSKRV